MKIHKQFTDSLLRKFRLAFSLGAMEEPVQENILEPLSKKDRQTLADALLKPPAPNRKLKLAASDYKKLTIKQNSRGGP